MSATRSINTRSTRSLERQLHRREGAERRDLEAIDGEEAAKDAFLESGSKDDYVVFLIHGEDESRAGDLSPRDGIKIEEMASCQRWGEILRGWNRTRLFKSSPEKCIYPTEPRGKIDIYYF